MTTMAKPVTPKDWEDHIRSLEADIENAKAARDEFLANSPATQLAIALHDVLCKSNHTDMCGWFYEVVDGKDQWNRYAHKTYLDKAARVMTELPDFDTDKIITIVKAIKS